MYGVLSQIEALISLKNAWLPPIFFFESQEYLLRSTFSGKFQTAQKYPCISKHRR